MTHKDALAELRVVADIIQRRQKPHDKAQRQALAKRIVAACDALELPETPCDTLPDMTAEGWGK